MNTQIGKPLLKYWLGVCLLMGLAPANAVSLLPGGNVNLTGTTVAARPELAGTVLVDNLVPFTLGDLSGNMQVRIVQETVAQTLDFYFNIRDLIGPAQGTGESVLATFHPGFAGWTTDVDFRTDGLGEVGPDSASRTADGSHVAFHFTSDPVGLDDIAPGDPVVSFFYFIKTTATAYAPGVFSLALSNGAGGLPFIDSIASYAPVPIPAALGLLGVALAVLGISRRREA